MRPDAARHHVVALVLVGAVAVLRLLLSPLVPGRPLGALFVLPITIAGLYGGVGPALTATAAALVAYLIVAIEPIGSLRVQDPSDLWQLALLAVVGACSALLVGRLRDSQQRSQLAARDLKRSLEERDRASETLRTVQQGFETLADGSPVLLWVNGPGGCEFVNRAYLDFLGVARDTEVRGYDWSRFIHPDDRDAYMQSYLRAYDARAPFGAEFRLRRSDGEWRWMRSEATLRVVEDRVVRYVGATIDITDRKTAEDALREADRRKDAFLAILAHELRNPLAPIRTGLELLRLAGDKPGTLDRVRPVIERQVGYMVRLIDDLLDVSRITSGKIHLQRQSTALVEVVQNAIEANRAALEDAGLTLSVSLPEVPCVLDVDPTRFAQVLSNILHNASKFTDRGGDVRIHGDIGESATGSRLTLSIRDTGSGISADMLPHVFDLFVQGQAGGRQKPGLGIGLALAKELVEMHGGQIEAHSDGPGQGSTFTIRMPVVAWAAGPGDLESRDLPRPIGRRVLVIDDNVDAADTLAELINALGGHAEAAHSGGAGLDYASTFQPDAILLDIGMPDMDGYETCRRLRQSFGRRVFIIALTGWGQPQDRQRALDEGFDAHLTKPADPVELATLLANVPSAT